MVILNKKVVKVGQKSATHLHYYDFDLLYVKVCNLKEIIVLNVLVVI